MNRPGMTGLTVLLAFLVVFVIEFRTVLTMVGIELASGLYYAGAAVVVLAALVGLYTLPDEDGKTNASNL